jgi:hypothetical protein
LHAIREAFAGVEKAKAAWRAIGLSRYFFNEPK